MYPEQKVAQILIKKKKTLAVAESCTGGLLSNRLTNIPGSSKYFQIGVIVYANRAKTNLLKVHKKTLQRYGAVSPQVAQAMSLGVKKLLKTDFGISITGIAGPSGGTKAKPVGLTFIAVTSREKTICKKYVFKGQRATIKSKAATKALQLLLDQL